MPKNKDDKPTIELALAPLSSQTPCSPGKHAFDRRERRRDRKHGGGGKRQFSPKSRFRG